MRDGQDSSISLDNWIARLNDGDPVACNEVLRRTDECLRLHTHNMLKDYRNVKRWEQTDDVFQNAVLRLLKALQSVQPDSARGFLCLAAREIRRELIDLARHYGGPQGLGANHASWQGGDDHERPQEPLYDPGNDTYDPSRLALWGELHEQIDGFPEEYREVFDLLWYQGLTQDEVAAVLDVSSATVRRRWRRAKQLLQPILQDSSLVS